MNTSLLSKSKPRLLIVQKKTAYQIYVEDRDDDRYKALLDRNDSAVEYVTDSNEAHLRTMARLTALLDGLQIPWSSVYREDLGFVARDVALVLAVGGDGTVLNTARHTADTALLGINSDPARSRGWLCAANADSMQALIEQTLDGSLRSQRRTRMRVTIGDRKLAPPVLNDVLIAHPNPASTSRYRIACADQWEEQRSSGIWISTATGSTGGIRSAGGARMPRGSRRLQYFVREPCRLPDGERFSQRRGFVGVTHQLRVRWASRQGSVFLDGAHTVYNLRMAETVGISNDAPPLNLICI